MCSILEETQRLQRAYCNAMESGERQCALPRSWLKWPPGAPYLAIQCMQIIFLETTLPEDALV